MTLEIEWLVIIRPFHAIVNTSHATVGLRRYSASHTYK
jgi:hypothetical protein